jgi:hypothetical protein
MIIVLSPYNLYTDEETEEQNTDYAKYPGNGDDYHSCDEKVMDTSKNGHESVLCYIHECSSIACNEREPTEIETCDTSDEVQHDTSDEVQHHSGNRGNKHLYRFIEAGSCVIFAIVVLSMRMHLSEYARHDAR